MTADCKHADEVIPNAALVRQLVRAQFPQWAEHPITPVESSGTDNAIFRLGATMAVRLPRRPSAVAQVEKEHHWLPRLAPSLALSIPAPLALGEPAEGYPWPWSVYSWLAGEVPARGQISDSAHAATDLAAFVKALQSLDATDGPPPGTHNGFRGAPLSRRDAAVRRALTACDDLVEADKAAAVWQAALRAPPWELPPVWLHGDLLPSNLLATDGRLCAVIDFGMLGVGDPACDLLPAWAIFEGEARQVFRAALGIDEAAWQRGRGWALSWALIALAYYRDRNPAMVEMALCTIDALLTGA